ncbi:MAG: hypothetical protein RL624_1206 [Bacteroidota bacterium]
MQEDVEIMIRRIGKTIEAGEEWPNTVQSNNLTFIKLTLKWGIITAIYLEGYCIFLLCYIVLCLLPTFNMRRSWHINKLGVSLQDRHH